MKPRQAIKILILVSAKVISEQRVVPNIPRQLIKDAVERCFEFAFQKKMTKEDKFKMGFFG